MVYRGNFFKKLNQRIYIIRRTDSNPPTPNKKSIIKKILYKKISIKKAIIEYS